MKSNTTVFLFETTDVRVSYNDIGTDGALIGISAHGEHIYFSGQTGKLLAVFRAVEHALLEREGIEHVHLGSDSEALSQEPF